MKRSGAFAGNSLLGLFLIGCGIPGAAALPTQPVEEALRKAVTYWVEEVAVSGGYVYFYSLDLNRRFGEGKASPTEIWVQPPATPTVGMALLAAYEATGDDDYLGSARAAGEALIYGQLESGGWRNSIDFDPSGPRVDQYRNGEGSGKNYSTLDDEISQSALEFLIRLDEALEFADEEIHDAARFGLDALLGAQFSNGAFPQVWRGKNGTVPERRASFPTYDWRTEGRIKEYWEQFTLNDRVADSVARVLIAAHRVYDDEQALESLLSLGEFLMLAQMPEPQPAWAQQYSREMHPIWARAFEPPAISGRESEDVIFALLRIADHTNLERFLKPIVPAVKYLESSLLPDGQLARYYELESNRPLYMKRVQGSYELTHDDSDLPSHYGWKNPNQLNVIKKAYRAQIAGDSIASFLETEDDSLPVAEILEDLDERGRWVSRYAGERLVGQAKFEAGEEYLSSEQFANRVTILSRYLKDNR